MLSLCLSIQIPTAPTWREENGTAARAEAALRTSSLSSKPPLAVQIWIHKMFAWFSHDSHMVLTWFPLLQRRIRHALSDHSISVYLSASREFERSLPERAQPRQPEHGHIANSRKLAEGQSKQAELKEFHFSKVFMPEKNILLLSLNLYLIFARYVFASLLPSTFLVKMSQASLRFSVSTSLHICSHGEMLQRLHHQHPPPGAREKRKK